MTQLRLWSPEELSRLLIQTPPMLGAPLQWHEPAPARRSLIRCSGVREAYSDEEIDEAAPGWETRQTRAAKTAGAYRRPDRWPR